MECIDYFKIVKWARMKALIWKNFLWMWRNIPVMAFIVGLPVVQTILFCFSIGHEPKNLHLSVVNYELSSPSEPCEFLNDCNSTKLSCNYLQFLKNNSIKLVSYLLYNILTCLLSRHYFVLRKLLRLSMNSISREWSIPRRRQNLSFCLVVFVSFCLHVCLSVAFL